MASPLTAAGASAEPSLYAPLHTNRIFTGLWTNRSPLRDAATSLYAERNYAGSRQDSIWGGMNTEITSELSLARRPGISVYNSQSFPPINRFYEFREFSAATENIRVMVDTAGAVYDGTGPSTKLNIWNKSAGAGKTYFQSVGNTLYMGNGVDQTKLVGSPLWWGAATAFNAGDFIVDSNNNIQVVAAGNACSITNVAISGGVASFTIYPPQRFATNTVLTPTGLTSAAFLNGTPLAVTFNPTLNIVTAKVASSDYASHADSGTLTLAAPTTSGAFMPTWDPGYGVATADGGLVWVNKGSATQPWGIAAPTISPTLATSPLPSIYPQWTPGTRYATAMVVVDAAKHAQVLTTGGTTGSSEPAWNDSPYLATTADGTCVWTNYGDVSWHPSTAFQVGALLSVTFTYYVTTYSYSSAGNGYQGNYQPAQQQQTKTVTPVTVTDYFSCTTAGVTGTAQPAWVQGQGATVADGSAAWINIGPSATWANDIKAGAKLSLAQTIVDANGNLQTIVTAGTSGTATPSWSPVQGATTVDGGCVWSCGGPYSAANTGSWTYAYAWGSSVSAEKSNLSPLSAPITRGANQLITVQGPSSPSATNDLIYLYRTVMNGAAQLFLASFPSTGPGNTWSFQDNTTDAALNVSLLGAMAFELSPPPAGLIALTYHLQRLFGAVQNAVYWSTGPDAVKFGAAGNSGWDPENIIVFPSRVVRLWPCSLGLIVFTVSDIYLIQGTATDSDPLVAVPFLYGTGLLSYDGFAVNGTTPYLLTTSLMIVSLDPGAGVMEVGFPIADQIEAHYTAASTLTFHQQTSSDTALYAGDGALGWYRLSTTTAPETGMAWSPQAIITGGARAVTSVETSPGVNQLLMGGVTAGPIYARDLTKRTDNGSPFVAPTTFGSIVLAQPGQQAAIQFLTLESRRVGTQPTLGVLLGEVSNYVFDKSGKDITRFETLYRTRQDPPNLLPSKTLWADRYHMAQNESPVVCRHFQWQLQWAAEDAANECLTFTIFGQLLSEFKSS